MARNELGKMRRSQILFNAGPGAIVDFRTHKGPVSVVCLGLEQYPPGPVIHEARLQRNLGISELRAPPAALDPRPNQPAGEAMPAVRFPRWMQCPGCALFQVDRGWGTEVAEPALHCSACSASSPRKVYVIPAPFVTACEEGHLADFPWPRWVDHLPTCLAKDKYRLWSDGVGGLSGLILACLGCGARKSMEGCFNPDALRPHPCPGSRPWLPDAPDEDCTAGGTAARRTLQRGASNLYFPVIVSSLDIPPWSDGLQHYLRPFWQLLVSKPNDKLLATLEVLELAEKIGLTNEELYQEVLRRRQLQEGSTSDLKPDEYKQLCADALPADSKCEFEIRPQVVPADLRPWVSRLVRVLRLREVRALRAFSRVRSPDPDTAGIPLTWAALSETQQNWLPGIEVRGEGIFVELDPGRITAWTPRLQARADEIDAAWGSEWSKRHPDIAPPRRITPKVLLVHSLAHAVIRQLSIECGYSAASLRERLYVDGDASGFLVYTAAPDSDGTLGGLARQGKVDQFRTVLENALTAQRWCASDPLCITDRHSFSESATGAACHSCLLASETSCEEFNRLLDRQALVGTPGDATVGYFHGSTLLE